MLSLFLILSCGSKSFDSAEDLDSYIRKAENGFITTTTVNGVNYNLLYKPRDLLVSQELRGNNTKRGIDSLRKKYQDQSYFNLTLSKQGEELLSKVSGGREQFGSLVNNLAFGMEGAIICVTSSNDTISLLDYIYPRMYGMSKSTSLLLVYRREDILKSERVRFIVKDLGFQTGDVQFYFDRDLFLEEPMINFKSD